MSKEEDSVNYLEKKERKVEGRKVEVELKYLASPATARAPVAHRQGNSATSPMRSGVWANSVVRAAFLALFARGFHAATSKLQPLRCRACIRKARAGCFEQIVCASCSSRLGEPARFIDKSFTSTWERRRPSCQVVGLIGKRPCGHRTNRLSNLEAAPSSVHTCFFTCYQQC